MVKKKLIDGKFYFRDSGAFGEKKNMLKYVAKLRKQGYQARIIREGKHYQAYYRITPKVAKLRPKIEAKRKKADEKLKVHKNKKFGKENFRLYSEMPMNKTSTKHYGSQLSQDGYKYRTVKIGRSYYIYYKKKKR